MKCKMRYEFTITLGGSGDTVEEAWEDAIEAFSLDPGVPPKEYTTEEEE